MYYLFCGTQYSLYSHKVNELNLQLGVAVGGDQQSSDRQGWLAGVPQFFRCTV